MRYYYNPERLKRLVKSLTAEYKRLAYFKKELLAQLEKQEAKEKHAIKKAILKAELLQKAGFGVGTVREWRGKKYKKIAQGKWRRIYDKEDRGAKMSIARLKKQVEKCESTKELLDLVLQNKSRFMDENGKPLPIVKELSAYAKEKGREKIKERAQNTKGVKNYFAQQNEQEKKAKKGIAEKNELTKKQIKNAVEPTQAEFEEIIDNIFSGNYKAVPSAIKLPSLQEELIEKLGVSGNFYLTQKRMKHINPQRKASHNNQDFRKEEYKDILNMIKNAKCAYIDTAKGNFLIAKKDKENENKANIICFNKDKLGNYIVTIKKVDKVELKKQGLEKVEVGVSPTITRRNGAPASNGHTGIPTDNSIKQKADSVKGKINFKAKTESTLRKYIDKAFRAFYVHKGERTYQDISDKDLINAVAANVLAMEAYTRGWRDDHPLHNLYEKSKSYVLMQLASKDLYNLMVAELEKRGYETTIWNERDHIEIHYKKAVVGYSEMQRVNRQ